MRSKSLRSFKELTNLLDQINNHNVEPALVLVKINPFDLIHLNEVNISAEALTIVSEDEDQTEGFVGVVTSDGYNLKESQLAISSL